MGYTEDDSQVRTEYFKLSGKWYCTEALDMSGQYDAMHAPLAVERARGNAHPEMWCVVLDPYHKGSYPVLMPPVMRRPAIAEPQIFYALMDQFEVEHAWRPDILWCVGEPPYPGRVVMTYDQFIQLAWPSKYPGST